MAVLVHKSVSRTLFSMAFPMLAGTFAMNAYNLTDTWFVSRLGTLPLAAMGFTFPVVMLLNCVAMGIGSGITTLVSHAIGRHDHEDAAKLVTHGILFIACTAVLMSVTGYMLIVPIFTKLGADVEILPLVSQYMRIWYLGALFMSMPMFGNGILISTGDSKSASSVMMLGTITNIILDPIMIFGYFGFPALGIRGAAAATVISQAISTFLLIYLFYKKHHLLIWRAWRVRDYIDSFSRTISFAIPGVLSMILMPISTTVITKIISGFGNSAVAAIGVTGRTEMFAFMIPMALGISLVPFVSQNLGAKQLGRIREARKFSMCFAICYTGMVAVLFFIGARWIAAFFTDDPRVEDTIVSYIRIVPFGYGMMEVHRYSGFFLTGLHKPNSTAILNGIRVLVLLIPLSYFGAYCFGILGVFAGRLVTDITAGIVGIVWSASLIKSVQAEIVSEASS